MSAEQEHGNRFERGLIHQSGLFPLMKDVVLPANALYDVPSDFSGDGIPVSVKTAKYAGRAPTISLSDAVRFYETTESSLRMLAGFYQVEGHRAIFDKIMEVVLAPEVMPILWGDVEQEEIAAFSKFIKEEKARIGEDPVLIQRLQADVRAYKETLEARQGAVVLNPKVARNVARLQCSIKADVLWSLAQDFGLVCAIYDKENGFGRFPLPVAFEVGARSSS